MKRISLIVALVGTTSATAAFGQANEVFFQQTDRAGGATVGVGILTIDQSGSAGNRIGISDSSRSFLKGAASVLTIRQINATTAQNITELSITGRDERPDQSRYVFVSNGNANTQRFTYVAPATMTDAFRISAEMQAVGDNNTITANFAQATDDAILDYYADVQGNSNTTTTSSSAGVGNILQAYYVVGDSNTLSFDFGAAAGQREATLYLNGSNNDWLLNLQSGGGKVDIDQRAHATSNNVTGRISQIGADRSFVRHYLDKLGDGAFSVTIAQTAADANGTAFVTALGTGSFTLNQGAPASYYHGTHVVAAGGSATINQF